MGVIADADAFRSLCQLVKKVYSVTFRDGDYGRYHVEIGSFSHGHYQERTSSGTSQHEALRKAVAGDWDEEDPRDA